MRACLVLACASLVGCAELIGIRDLGDGGVAANDASEASPAETGADAAPPPGTCTTSILTVTTDTTTAVVARAGFVYVIEDDGVARCASNGSCTDPPLVVSAQPAAFEAAAIGSSSIAYAVQTVTGEGVRAAGLDGSGDKLVYGTADAVDVALGDTQTYWTDDATSDVHCIGCAGGDATWISGLSPTAIFADATSVYVISSDSSGTTWSIYSCGASTACSIAPPLVLGGLTDEPTNASVASDGAFVYVARENDVVRSNGTQQNIVLTSATVALAVDPASGDFFFATPTGDVGRTKRDGSGAPTTLATCAGAPLSLAYDATNVYALVPIGSGFSVFAIAR